MWTTVCSNPGLMHVVHFAEDQIEFLPEAYNMHNCIFEIPSNVAGLMSLVFRITFLSLFLFSQYSIVLLWLYQISAD